VNPRAAQIATTLANPMAQQQVSEKDNSSESVKFSPVPSGSTIVSID